MRDMNKATVQTSALVDAVAICAMATKKRNPNPVTQAIHLRPGPLGVEVYATNFVVAIGVGVASEGQISASIPSEQFAAAVRALDGETANLSRDGTKLVLSSDNTKFRLETTDPSLMTIQANDGKPFAVDGDELADAINGVAFAADSSEVHSWTNGINLAPSKAALTLSATNKKTFARQRISGVFADASPCMISVPHAEILAVIVAGGSAEITISETGVLAKSGERWMQCTALEAKFMEVDGFLFREMETKGSARVKRDVISEAIRSAAIMADINNYAAVRFESGRFSVITGNGNGVAGGACEGKQAFSFVVNHAYLSNAIRHTGGEEVEIALVSCGNAAPTIRINPSSEHKIVIQPINIDPATINVAA